MNKKHLTYQQLQLFLKNKHKLSKREIDNIKNHVDNCCLCWKTWNMVRWDKAAANNKLIELKEYLGNQFIPYYDSSWALAYEWNHQSPHSKKEIEKFYQNTNNYIYNSFIFEASSDRINLDQIYKKIKNEYHIKSILDFGAGIGTDGLKMMNLGMKVYFADISLPNLNFLKWRLNKRKADPSFVLNLNNQSIDKPDVEAIWSIDVLEHMFDPHEIFNFFSTKTRLFVYFIDDDSNNGGRHPFHFKFNHKLFSNKLKKMGFKHNQFQQAQIWLKE